MKIIAYDLGTGGVKASLFEESGESVAESFIPYDTRYPCDRWHEQRPEDWWESVSRSTRLLLEKSGIEPSEIACAALSGHSLVVAPLDKDGRLLTEFVPIWSDTRADDCVAEFFSDLSYEDWYLNTGNGDPPPCYSIFKLMWIKKHQSEVFGKIHQVLGSKDYINYKLTGQIATDPSYASGFGVFDLLKWDYEDRFFEASSISRDIFPSIQPSDSLVGYVTKDAAAQTGLPEGLPIACGGVDNTCMALGAVGIDEGRVYTSLGSSAWIAVNSRMPVLDLKTRPFVFAHAQKGYYTSAVSIFSAGNSFRWIRDELCRDISKEEDAYDRMNRMAENVPVGSHGVLFNPTLAGGSAQEVSSGAKGSFLGLTLSTTREDLVRASMEGIALALKETLDILQAKVSVNNQMLMCGGGSKSLLWRKIFADVFNLNIIKTNVDQDAAALGAAALAANACGLWNGYDKIESLHKIESTEKPVPENTRIYRQLQKIYRQWMEKTAILDEIK